MQHILIIDTGLGSVVLATAQLTANSYTTDVELAFYNDLSRYWQTFLQRVAVFLTELKETD